MKDPLAEWKVDDECKKFEYIMNVDWFKGMDTHVCM